MSKRRSSRLYRLLKYPVWLLVQLFYRRIEIRGAHHIPRSGPVILIANHQNALLDPLVCSVLLHREINWLTRSDVFRNPLANVLLRGLNMLPVYRERDNTDLISKNELTFQECEERLILGSVIGLFPEGSHHGQKYLRPFRKGLARIVQRAAKRGIQGIKIVPVGIDYSNYQRWGSDLVLIVGEPIDADACIRACDDASGAACLRYISRETEISLRRCMIHIPDETLYNALLPIADHLATALEIHGNENWRRFESLRQLSSFAVGLHREHEKWIELAHEYENFEALPSPKAGAGIEILKILLLPFHLLLKSFRLFVAYLANKCTRDKQFIGSFRFVLAAVLFPVFLCVVFYVVRFVAGNLPAAIAVVGILATAMVSFKTASGWSLVVSKAPDTWFNSLRELLHRTKGH